LLAFQVEEGKLRVVAEPAPKLRPGWALVRVRLAGICYTDVARMIHFSRERFQLQLIADAFNILNRPNVDEVYSV